MSQLLGFSKRVFEFTKPVDQLIVERIFARKNSAIGDRVAQQIGRKISLLRDDAEKLVVGFHDETLDQFAFLRGDRSRTIEHVLEFAALKNDGSQSDFVEQLFVIQRLDDD